MNGATVDEQCAAAMVDEMVAEIKSEFLKKSAEERAFILIRGFFDVAERMWNEGEAMPEKMYDEFRDWLDDPQNRAAKMRALDRMIGMDDERLREYGFTDHGGSLPSGIRQEPAGTGRVN